MASRELTIFRAHVQEALLAAKEGEGELLVLYQEVANDVRSRIAQAGERVTAVKLQTEIDEAFAKTYFRRVKAVRVSIERGAKLGPKAARKTMRAVYGEEVAQAQVRSSAKALAEASERIAGRVTVDGISLGRRMRRVDRTISADMAREVEGGIRQRRGILGAARRIEKLDPRSVELPQYLQDLEVAARHGNVTEVKRLVQQYGKRIAQLGEAQVDGTFLASKYSLKTATKRFVDQVQKASHKGIDNIVKKYVTERAAFRANVIARSETVEAMRQSYVKAAANKPGVVCFQWARSSRHESHEHGGSKRDVCDILASQNAYGLGPGRYPADKVPKMPHPSCICACHAVMDRKYFERPEAERGQVPAEMRDARSPDAIGWLRQNPQQAAAILGPTRNQLLHQGVNVLDANGAPRLVRDLLPAGRVAAE